MRLSALFLALPALGVAQVWEKPLAPGLLYRTEVRLEDPLVIHAVRLSFGAPGVRARPALAGDAVYGPLPLRGRGTVSTIVREQDAWGGVNADFFPLGGGKGTGNPLGAMVQGGELASIPVQKRAVFAWGAAAAAAGFVRWTGTVQVGNSSPVPLDGLNDETPLNRVCLFTPRSGLAISKAPCLSLLVKMDATGFGPNVDAVGRVVAIEADREESEIPVGHVRIVAQGTKTDALRSANVGDAVRVVSRAEGFDWSRFTEAVGGGPFLVQGGKVFVDAAEEGLNAAFSERRHPRTAIGRTPEGDLWLFTVDGRSAVSRGLTLAETAREMLALGCVDAINLDGGGSTALSLFGRAVNRPSDGDERPVANAVVFFGPDSPAPAGVPHLSLTGAGAGAYTARLDVGGKPVPNVEVVWSCTGDAWVDGGGTVRPLADGRASLRAVWRGRSVEGVWPVKAPSAATSRSASGSRGSASPRPSRPR